METCNQIIDNYISILKTKNMYVFGKLWVKNVENILLYYFMLTKRVFMF